MLRHMYQRRGTAAQWSTDNPVLADGEIGFVRDTGQIKVGNGTTAWNALPFTTDQAVTDALAAVGARDALYRNLAADPDTLIAGTITRDVNNAATSAPVSWPDGTVGTYTALAVSSAFPGAVDSYKITYGSPATKTYTQPTVTRNSAGAVTVRPAMTVT